MIAAKSNKFPIFLSFSDCGKQKFQRVGSEGVQHSTGVNSSILEVSTHYFENCEKSWTKVPT